MKTEHTFEKVITELNLQKDRLGISYRAISKRTDISEATLQRIFSGNHKTTHFAHMLLIADVLGVDIMARIARSAEDIRKEQAEKKADYLIRLIKGNSALEGQGSSPKAYRRMKDKTVNELLSGSKRLLWAA